MVKTPEEYFQAQDFDPPQPGGTEDLTVAERAFMDKYMGVDGAAALGISPAAGMGGITEEVKAVYVPLDEELRGERTIQMVSFILASQVYTIPIVAVQEVIRYMPPVLLPMAPDYVAGVVNLRGRVTPLIYLDKLLTNEPRKGGEEQFIIICSRRGLQIGLMIDKVHTMYMIEQQQIIWNVESQIGASAEYLCGLVNIDESIFGIVSIDLIIDQVLQR